MIGSADSWASEALDNMRANGVRTLAAWCLDAL